MLRLTFTLCVLRQFTPFLVVLGFHAAGSVGTCRLSFVHQKVHLYFAICLLIILRPHHLLLTSSSVFISSGRFLSNLGAANTA